MINKKKRILIVGSKEFFSLELMYCRAFKSLNHEVKLLHIYNIKKNLIRKIFWKFFKFIHFIFYRKQLLKYLKNHNKNYDLIIIFKGIYLNNKTIINCKKICKNSVFINFFSDDPFELSNYHDISNNSVLSSIKYYDFFFIWSQKLCGKIKKKLKMKNVVYLPFGYDQYIHKKKIIKKNPKFDLFFFGAADKQRIKIINKLKNYKVIVAGLGWKNKNLSSKIKIINKIINANEISRIIQNSKITLNILRKQNYGSNNMKTFEITSMNGLMLTKRTKEQKIFFPENKSCLMYGNISELLVKTKAVTANYKNFLKVRLMGNKLSQGHSYKNRAKFILKEIDK